MIGSSKSLSGFDPRSVPGCQLWLDPANSSSLTLSGANVVTIADSSTTGVTATRLAGNSYATTTTISGNRILSFSSENIVYRSPMVLTGAAYTIFVIGSLLSGSGYQRIVNTDGSGGRIFIGANNGSFVTFTGNNNFNDVAVNTPGYTLTGAGLQLMSMVVSGSSLIPYINGTAMNTKTGTTGATTVLDIGAYEDGVTQAWKGYIGDIIVYNSALTTSQRQQVEGYLAHKWGLVPYYDSSTPLTIPGCTLWLDAADTSSITLSGSNVTQWSDKSGNGLNVSAASSQPTYVTNAVNGLGTLAFNGSQNLTAGSVTGERLIGNSGNCALFVVMKLNSSPGRNMPFSWDDGNYTARLIIQYDENSILAADKGVFPNRTQATITLSNTLYYLISYSQNGSNTSLNVNGTTVGTLTNSANNSITSSTRVFNVGSYVNGSDWNMKGNTAEIIFFNTHIPNSFKQVENYLMKKWAIGTNPTIPSTHPFSSIRPHLRAFQPTDIDGCQLWLDGADQSSMTLSGSNVTQWIDKSGNGYNFITQGSFAAPVISNNAISTNSAVSFTGNSTQNNTSNQILTNSSFPLNSSSAGYSIFTVTTQNASHPSYTGYNYILSAYGGGTGAGLLYGTTNSNLLITANGTSGAFYGFNDLTANVPNTLMTSTNQTSMIVSGSVLTPYLNGVAMSTKTGTSDAVTGISIGNAYAPGQTFTGQTWGGLICEVLIYNSALTTSQRQTIEGYLAHKWGLLPPSSITPLTIPGCQLWLDVTDSSTTVSSGSVTSITNKCTNTAATLSSTLPTYNSSLINGLPGINFTGSSFIRGNFSSAYTGSNLIVFAVGSLSSTITTAYARLVSFSVPGSLDYNSVERVGAILRQLQIQGISSYRNGGEIGSGTGIAYNTNYLFCTEFTGTTYNFYLNGSKTSTASSSGSFNISAWGVGYLADYGGSDDAAYWKGSFGECITYLGSLTTAQRQTIENYLLNKWGISNTSSSLISTHPFSRIPPATSAHFSPTSISGCQLWLDAADSSVVTIATGVSQWNDKSGNSNNLTQSTTGSQPTYASSLITFANDKYLNIPSTVLNNLPTWSLFFVINPISTSNWIMSRQRDYVDSYNILSMTISSTNYGGVQSGSAGFLYWRSMNAGTQLGSTDSLATSTLQTCTLTYDGTILYFYKNGELNQATTGSFAIQNQTSPSTYTLGALIYPSGIDNSGVTNFRLGEMISYNTFLTNAQRERVEGYLSHKWGLLSSLSSINPYKTLPPIFPPIIQYNIIATGGTIVSAAGTTYHVFRTSSSFVVRRSVTVNYLVVGGGGGGGDRHGGGGGAGGVLSGNWSASAGTYIITVGAGGQYGSTNEGGQIAYGTPNGSGTKGGDSLLSGTGISVTAYGGGGGGSYDGNPSGTVGSGGGGGGQNLSGVAGTAGQGNAGGSGSNPGAGGGGGAGGAGVAANTGTGGIGTSSFSSHLLAVGYGTTFAVPTSPNTVISGGVAYIAGGGGGCAGTSPGPGGSGGLGGGGRGDWADANITAGTPNTGGGGGGTRSDLDALQTTGRNGGSGLVLVWY
jgi:hypothetical protein